MTLADPSGTSRTVEADVSLHQGRYPGSSLCERSPKTMVVYHRRAGGQSQHSTLLGLDATSDRVQSALAYAKENLGKRLSVDDLAAAA